MLNVLVLFSDWGGKVARLEIHVDGGVK